MPEKRKIVYLLDLAELYWPDLDWGNMVVDHDSDDEKTYITWECGDLTGLLVANDSGILFVDNGVKSCFIPKSIVDFIAKSGN